MITEEDCKHVFKNNIPAIFWCLSGCCGICWLCYKLIKNKEFQNMCEHKLKDGTSAGWYDGPYGYYICSICYKDLPEEK
jgi:hypothetical protein